MKKKGWIIAIIIVVAYFLFIRSIAGNGSKNRRNNPKTYNEAYKEYQNGNKAPLEGFYNWLEKNP